MSTDNRNSSISLAAIRNAAGSSVVVFDVSNRTQIEVRGADRARFLHSFMSNDIKSLKPGTGCETFVTSLKGKVVAHVYVFCREDSHWLDGAPQQQSAILPHLQKFVLIDDVQLIAHEDDFGELFVSGPLATQLLQLPETMRIGDSEQRELHDTAIDIRRVDLFGAPGFLMSIPRSQVDRVKQGMISVGIPEGTSDQFEYLRIEAGYPLFGQDFTEDYLAQEVARTRQCVSFNKGCYLGQETIARLDALGHTNREIRRIRFESPIAPASGSPVFDAAGESEVGVLTSAASDSENPDPAQTKGVGIGTLKRAVCPAGSVVRVKSNGNLIEGQVL
ncbi:CAF17-like 4Fe-4S cluster assembly/insertion protein YgfZ [Schlesneria sp.]|uniref:CAF17-like 4Fe-4S cluster assembly/insertion protein YgfZ n=1 Tax=Schlesneria sp. TaxID=2762018 RepID=UPI002F217E95